jgi:SPP1 family predicted phage head-tail adaptor
MGLKAGSLNKLVTIQAKTDTVDAIGQPINTWVDVATVWADIRYLSGLESIKSDAPNSIAKVSIRVRYRADITPAMRVVAGSIVYKITAVLPDKKNRSVDLACEVVQ